MTAANIHPVAKEALWLLLGDALDNDGKERWLAARWNAGFYVEEIFEDALALLPRRRTGGAE